MSLTQKTAVSGSQSPARRFPTSGGCLDARRLPGTSPRGSNRGTLSPNKFKNKTLWKKRLSQALTGRVMSTQWRERLSIAAKKRWESPVERLRMRKLKLGKKLSNEQKTHISSSIKKLWEDRHRQGYQHSEAAKGKMAASVRKNVKVALVSGTFVKGLCKSCKRKVPLFEKEFCRCLRRLHIRYRTQVPLLKRFVADVLLYDSKIIIECDGSYWHSLPSVKAKDRRRDIQLRQAGFTVLHVNESKFKKNYMEAAIWALWALRKLQIAF